MTAATKNVSVKLDSKLYTALKTRAELNGSNVSDEIRSLLRSALATEGLDLYGNEVADFIRGVVDARMDVAALDIERKLDARLSQLQDVRHAPLGEITLIHSPALRLFWIDTALTAPDYSALELSTSRLAAAQAEALVFLGKVGFSVSQEHLNEGSFGQYDGEFLVLDEADRFTGDVIDLPASLCACVRFRGHHAESPAQYRRLMQFIREEGCTAAGFSREITVIDYGFTPDTEKFVTEIMIPLQKV